MSRNTRQKIAATEQERRSSQDKEKAKPKQVAKSPPKTTPVQSKVSTAQKEKAPLKQIKKVANTTGAKSIKLVEVKQATEQELREDEENKKAKEKKLNENFIEEEVQEEEREVAKVLQKQHDEKGQHQSNSQEDQEQKVQRQMNDFGEKGQDSNGKDKQMNTKQQSDWAVLKKQKKQLNRYETTHQKKLYDEQNQKKDLHQPSGSELALSRADGVQGKRLSQQSDEEKVECMEAYDDVPPQWNHPGEVCDLAELLEKIVLEALTYSDSEKVLDSLFEQWKIASIKHDVDDCLEYDLRKHITKHQTPIEIKNDGDAKLTKEIQTFVRSMVKPTLQSGLLLQDVLNDEQLMYHRDNPSIAVQTQRFVDLLIKCYGKDEVSQHAESFLHTLTLFNVTFDSKTKSENCHWKQFTVFKPLLCLSGSVGGYCQKQCGKIHADIFSHDGCKFSNAHTDDEKEELKKEHDLYMTERKKDKTTAKPVPKLNSAQKLSIEERVKDLILLKDEKNPVCLMCLPINNTACIPALKEYLNKNDYASLQAWFDKHTKYMIAIFVGLLPDALALVDKKMIFPLDKFKEFILCVKDVDGPIMPLDPRGHPCLLKLLSSVQAKIQGLIFKDESEYTQNQNVVIKQNQISGTALMRATTVPMEMTPKQERRMRHYLQQATMENADRQVKHAVKGRLVAEKQRDQYAHENRRLVDDNLALQKRESDMRMGMNVLLTNQQQNVEIQMQRDRIAAEQKKRQDDKDERLEQEREAQRKREERAAKEKHDFLMAAVLSNKAAQIAPILALTAPLVLNQQSTLARLKNKVASARDRYKNCSRRDSKQRRKYKNALERAIGKYKDEKKVQSGKEQRLVPHGQKPESDDESEDKEVIARPAKKEKSQKSKSKSRLQPKSKKQKKRSKSESDSDSKNNSQPEFYETGSDNSNDYDEDESEDI